MAYTKNMTEGKPFQIIFAYFIPVLCSTLFQQLYSMVDAIVVGKGIDDLALTAVSATGSISYFLFGFIMGLGSGMSVLMAQAYGSGNYQHLRKTITMGIITCGVVGISIMVASIAAMRPFLVFLKTDARIIDDAYLYIVIVLAGIPLTLVYNCLSAILSALGDSKTPLVAVLISTVINVVLDLIFIVCFGMGVEGAAIATLIAQGCSGVFCFMKTRKIEFIQLKKSDWKIDKALIFSQIKIGIPVAFMNSITAIGTILLQYFVNILGIHYAAAYSACTRITQFALQPCTAVGMTISTYAGQNFGAGKFDRINEGIKSAFKISLTIAIVTGVILIIAPKTLVSIMLSEPGNINLSIGYLRVCGIMMWSIAFLFLVRNTLQGMGFTVVPMLSGFLELAARVIVVFAFSQTLGYIAIALSEVSAWTAAFLLNGICLFFKMRSLKKQQKEQGI